MNIKTNSFRYAACNLNAHDIYRTNNIGFENRVFNRPLSGGMSLGNFLNMYGTLGGLFRDNTDGTIVGLTCRHVCDKMLYTAVSRGDEINPVTFPAKRYPLDYDYIRTRFTSLCDRYNPAFTINEAVVISRDLYPNNFLKEYSNFYYNKTYKGVTYRNRTYDRPEATRFTDILNMPIYQPGYPLFQTTTYIDFISGFSVPANSLSTKYYPYTIGHVKRVVPLTTDERKYNEIDSAVIAIEKPLYEELILNESSCNFIGFNKTGGSIFATTSEINSLSNTPTIPLFKTGAGTGSIGFPGTITTNCYTLSFNGFYNFVLVEGVGYANGISFTLGDQTPTNSDMTPLSTLEGDSGSMLWALFNATSPTTSAWKIIGQIFAYVPSNTPPIIGLASRIDKIQELLNISPWDGKNISFTPSTPRFFTLFDMGETTIKMGRKCFRVSNTNAVSASYITGNTTITPVMSTSKPSFYMYFIDYMNYNDQLMTFGNF